MVDGIVIRGARVHNLKGVDCELPRNRLVVITGPSGSGKSSLAFDTLYAEGQRRYMESLSAYARQFLDQVEKPEVESVSGLMPAIAIDQRTTSGHPRSTVGTVTEVYDRLRLLFAAVGRPHCPRCGEEVKAQSAEEVAARVAAAARGGVVGVLAPVVRGRKGAFRRELEALRGQGYHRVRVDGRAFDLDDPLPLDSRRRHRVEVLVDRFVLRPGGERRLSSSLERAFELAGDAALVDFGGEERLFSRRLACARCDVSIPELSPRAFSFNSRYGACERCLGLGSAWELDPERALTGRTLGEAALLAWGPGRSGAREALEAFAGRQGLGLEHSLDSLSPEAREALLVGDGAFPGLANGLRRRARAALDVPDPEDAEHPLFEDLRPLLHLAPCPRCRGGRLRPESLAVRVGTWGIADLARLSVAEARAALGALEFPERERPVALRVLPDALARLDLLARLGLGYLSLDRPAATLAGGEGHRVRLAGQIGAGLRGVLYVLDEPSVGLHPRDNARLLETLFRIRDAGNTVVVVEHEPDTIRAADWVLDLGEGAGAAGGRLLYQGPPAHLNGSLTGRYLRGEYSIPLPAHRRSPAGWLRIRGAREHNLRGIDASFPLGALTAVTGVSGAGKSTLVEDILYRALVRILGGAATPGRHDRLEGAEAVEAVLCIDQTPIGRTPRSNPATYSGALAIIRELFASLPEARLRGYRPGRFSFNVKGGRCETCQGDGMRAVRMNFLPDAYVLCEACRGRRYNAETLDVRYRGRSVAEVLDLTVAEALAHLSAHPRLVRLLATLVEVGLGYLRLGQSAVTLSGGEAQRLKLARELARRETGRTLYILDEPTTGLHFGDVARLLHVLNRLVDAGNTVVVVEHNLDVVKSADYVIDLGPEGGVAGGRVVVEGTPEEIAGAPRSHTGAALRAALAATGSPEEAA